MRVRINTQPPQYIHNIHNIHNTHKILLTLDVVVEAVVSVPVLLQQRHGLGGLEVLELDNRVGPAPSHSLGDGGAVNTAVRHSRMGRILCFF